jgi:hypothetical protein
MTPAIADANDLVRAAVKMRREQQAAGKPADVRAERDTSGKGLRPVRIDELQSEPGEQDDPGGQLHPQDAGQQQAELVPGMVMTLIPSPLKVLSSEPSVLSRITLKSLFPMPVLLTPTTTSLPSF